MNSVNIVGRIGNDIGIETTTTGKQVVNINVGVQRDKDNTDWVECTAFDKTAELISQYFNKGSLIGVSGALRTNRFTDKQGNKRSKTFVLINTVTFLEAKKSKPEQQQTSNTNPYGDDVIDVSSDDLPF